MQSAGGASGSACFDAAGRVVGALFAGGETADPRFAGGLYKTEAIMVAADYVRDALDDGVRGLVAPARGSTGLELDLVPIAAAASFYGLPPEEVAKIKMPDLNANDLEAAKQQVRGTARSMGLTVVG